MAAAPLTGSRTLQAGERLCSLRCRFQVASSGVVTIVEAIANRQLVLAQTVDQVATVELHAVWPDSRLTADLAHQVYLAYLGPVVGAQGVSVVSLGCDVAVEWPRDDRRIWTHTPAGDHGGSLSAPLPSLLSAPWELIVGPGAPRRRGRTHWPGLGAAGVDSASLTLTGAALDQWSTAARDFAAALRATGARWVVANPRRDGGAHWTVRDVQVRAQLRPFRRRWPVTGVGPAWVSPSLSFPLPLPRLP